MSGKRVGDEQLRHFVSQVCQAVVNARCPPTLSCSCRCCLRYRAERVRLQWQRLQQAPLQYGALYPLQCQVPRAVDMPGLTHLNNGRKPVYDSQFQLQTFEDPQWSKLVKKWFQDVPSSNDSQWLYLNVWLHSQSLEEDVLLEQWALQVKAGGGSGSNSRQSLNPAKERRSLALALRIVTAMLRTLPTHDVFSRCMEVQSEWEVEGARVREGFVKKYRLHRTAMPCDSCTSDHSSGSQDFLRTSPPRKFRHQPLSRFCACACHQYCQDPRVSLPALMYYTVTPFRDRVFPVKRALLPPIAPRTARDKNSAGEEKQSQSYSQSQQSAQQQRVSQTRRLEKFIRVFEIAGARPIFMHVRHRLYNQHRRQQEWSEETLQAIVPKFKRGNPGTLPPLGQTVSRDRPTRSQTLSSRTPTPQSQRDAGTPESPSLRTVPLSQAGRDGSGAQHTQSRQQGKSMQAPGHHRSTESPGSPGGSALTPHTPCSSTTGSSVSSGGPASSRGSEGTGSSTSSREGEGTSSTPQTGQCTTNTPHTGHGSAHRDGRETGTAHAAGASGSSHHSGGGTQRDARVVVESGVASSSAGQQGSAVDGGDGNTASNGSTATDHRNSASGGSSTTDYRTPVTTKTQGSQSSHTQSTIAQDLTPQGVDDSQSEPAGPVSQTGPKAAADPGSCGSGPVSQTGPESQTGPASQTDGLPPVAAQGNDPQPQAAPQQDDGESHEGGMSGRGESDTHAQQEATLNDKAPLGEKNAQAASDTAQVVARTAQTGPSDRPAAPQLARSLSELAGRSDGPRMHTALLRMYALFGRQLGLRQSNSWGLCGATNEHKEMSGGETRGDEQDSAKSDEPNGDKSTVPAFSSTDTDPTATSAQSPQPSASLSQPKPAGSPAWALWGNEIDGESGHPVWLKPDDDPQQSLEALRAAVQRAVTMVSNLHPAPTYTPDPSRTSQQDRSYSRPHQTGPDGSHTAPGTATGSASTGSLGSASEERKSQGQAATVAPKKRSSVPPRPSLLSTMLDKQTRTGSRTSPPHTAGDAAADGGQRSPPDQTPALSSAQSGGPAVTVLSGGSSPTHRTASSPVHAGVHGTTPGSAEAPDSLDQPWSIGNTPLVDDHGGMTGGGPSGMFGSLSHTAASQQQPGGGAAQQAASPPDGADTTTADGYPPWLAMLLSPRRGQTAGQQPSALPGGADGQGAGRPTDSSPSGSTQSSPAREPLVRTHSDPIRCMVDPSVVQQLGGQAVDQLLAQLRKDTPGQLSQLVQALRRCHAGHHPYAEHPDNDTAQECGPQDGHVQEGKLSHSRAGGADGTGVDGAESSDSDSDWRPAFIGWAVDDGAIEMPARASTPQGGRWVLGETEGACAALRSTIAQQLCLSPAKHQSLSSSSDGRGGSEGWTGRETGHGGGGGGDGGQGLSLSAFSAGLARVRPTVQVYSHLDDMSFIYQMLAQYEDGL